MLSWFMDSVMIFILLLVIIICNIYVENRLLLMIFVIQFVDYSHFSPVIFWGTDFNLLKQTPDS